MFTRTSYKRPIAALAVAAALVTGSVGPALAEPGDPACSTIPALPDECLSPATLAYIAGVEADRAEDARLLGLVREDRDQLQRAAWVLADEKQAALQQASIAAADRDEALAALARANTRVGRLLGRVDRLRARVAALKAALDGRRG